MDKCITKPEKSPGHTEYDYRLLEDNYYMEDDKSPFTPENTLRPGVKVVIVDASPADLHDSIQMSHSPQTPPVSAEVLAVVGQEVKLSYEVTGHPSPTLTWTRPDQGLKPVTRLDARIQAADTGVYTCQVTNPGGRLYREVEVVVEVPPHLTLLPHTAEVTQGERFVVECEAVGVPVPSIS
ncbi:hypothetical protein Pcinc_017530 [Petrolisthes cinctipes]|uniref:Ig-like domain-containing protein n=1 Tax=Petrolisthes cinctipes TaxID=88211 RepID=A0AAE1FP41_PETCI|nr:hypothetical protein Pcinc_017530 [Petrolisthes cinctipes]